MCTSKISRKIDDTKSLNINIYEIKVNDELLKDKSIIDVFLFNCKCAILLVDMISKKSFDLIKELTKKIKLDNFPYLKLILVQNKSDLESEKKINSNEIEEFLNENASIQNETISLKEGININNLLNKIYTAINETKTQLPCDLILESTESNISLINYHSSLSFILIGDSTVGKSCFFKRYFKNEFTEEIFHTIGIDKEAKHVKIGKKSLKVTLWDTAGQEKFRFLPKKYYRNADGILLLFDVTNEDSFNNVSSWMSDVKENSNRKSTTNDKETDISIYLIGNKIDLPNREVTKEQAEIQANSLGVKYFEISCKINMNIPEVIQNMIMDCYSKGNKHDNGIQINNNKKENKNSCC